MTLDVGAIGRRVADQRERLQLEQEDVAVASGMSRAYVSRLENGGVLNPKVTDLASVAAALGLSLDRLIYGHDSGDAQADLSSLLMSLLDPEVGAIVASALRKYPDLKPMQRHFFVHALQSL